MTDSTTSTRKQVSVQIAPADRQLIERAADLAGQAVEEFVRYGAIRAAHRILRDYAVIQLTTRGWEQLADLVETDESPNEALLRAAERNWDVQPVAPARPA